jgi:hypothetical protein
VAFSLVIKLLLWDCLLAFYDLRLPLRPICIAWCCMYSTWTVRLAFCDGLLFCVHPLFCPVPFCKDFENHLLACFNTLRTQPASPGPRSPDMPCRRRIVFSSSDISTRDTPHPAPDVLIRTRHWAMFDSIRGAWIEDFPPLKG